MDKEQFFRACRDGNLATVKQYLAIPGADLNLQDTSGRTGLHWACLRNYLEVIWELLAHRANWEIKDKYGDIPIDYAQRSPELLAIFQPYIEQKERMDRLPPPYESEETKRQKKIDNFEIKELFLKEYFIKTAQKKKLYHGSPFPNLTKITAGKGYRWSPLKGNYNVFNHVVFLTENYDVAKEYATNRVDWLESQPDGKLLSSMYGYVYEIQIDISNFADMTTEEKAENILQQCGIEDMYANGWDLESLWQLFDNQEYVDKMKNIGYRGAIIIERDPRRESHSETGVNAVSYISFYPEQNKIIRHQKGDKSAFKRTSNPPKR